MKILKSMLLGLVLTIFIFSLTGCQQAKDQFYGDWAYNHDTETTIISFKSNNKAVFNGEKYKYTFDDKFITLKSGDEELKLRYEWDNDYWLLYLPETYYYEGEKSSDGIVGRWVDRQTNWSYEFTADGTFRENDCFPGYYLDNNDGSILLVYNDQFYDTTIYYTINNDEMTVEYPWTMVKTSKTK